MSTKLTARAQAVKAATDGKVLVVATSDRSILEAEHVHKVLAGFEFRNHTCGDCGTEITASVDSLPRPFCPVCSSMELRASSTPVHSHYTSDDHLASFKCGGCGQSNIMDDRVVKASGGKLSCASCGVQLKVSASTDEEDSDDDDVKAAKKDDNFGGKKAPPFTSEDAEKARAKKKVKSSDEDEEDEDEEDDEEDDDKEEGKKAKASVTASSWPFGATKSFQKASIVDPNDEVDNFLISMEDDDSPDSDLIDTAGGGDFTFSDPVSETLVMDPSSTSMDPVDSFDAAEGVGFNEFSHDFPLDNGTVGQDERVIPGNVMGFEGETTYDDLPEIVSGSSILQACKLDDTDKLVNFVRAGNRLVAMKGHHAVATLSASAAGHNADVMFTDAFSQVLKASAAEKGLRKTLKAFAFQTMCVPVITPETLAKETKKIAASAADTVNKREVAFADSLAIVATALGRNMLKDVQNPLAAAIQAELASAGVRNPVRRTTAILASVGVEFSRVLCQQAALMAAKPESHREALAAALEMTRPAKTASAEKDFRLSASGEDDPEEDDDDDDTEVDASASSALTARFHRASASSSVPALLKSPVALSGSAGRSEAERVLAGSARLSFGA